MPGALGGTPWASNLRYILQTDNFNEVSQLGFFDLSFMHTGYEYLYKLRDIT